MRSAWVRHFVYRAACVKTTWALQVAVLLVLVVVPWATSACWTAAIGRSLVCESGLAPSDAILIENFDPDYLLFERARHLREVGIATRVLVPIRSEGERAELSAVSLGIAEVMVRISRVGPVEFVAIREVEPISLNAALDIGRFLSRTRVRSVVVVSPLFRSRRSQLVYGATLGAAGITVRCSPVEGTRGVATWTRSWHGIQDVVEQWGKLQYYRLWVLPFHLPRATGPAGDR